MNPTRNLKICGALTLAACALTLSASSLCFAQTSTAKPFLVVIDPGHGGADHGASVQVDGVTITEKEVTLTLAKQVATELARRGIRVALTRTEDKEVALPDRTALANKLGASVFISLHLNSSEAGPEGLAEGIETYILNNSSDTSSKRLADLENSVLQGSSANQLVSANSAGDVALIVKDLMLDANLTESKRLGCAVQGQLVNSTSTSSTRYRNRGVKQALFYVLLGADMPSILVEAGFLNNPRDRMIVTSPMGQRRMSQSIANALSEFRLGMGRLATSRALARCKMGEHPLSPRKTVQQAFRN